MYWSRIRQDQRNSLTGKTLSLAESVTKSTYIRMNDLECQLNQLEQFHQ